MAIKSAIFLKLCNIFIKIILTYILNSLHKLKNIFYKITKKSSQRYSNLKLIKIAGRKCNF